MRGKRTYGKNALALCLQVVRNLVIIYNAVSRTETETGLSWIYKKNPMGGKLFPIGYLVKTTSQVLQFMLQ